MKINPEWISSHYDEIERYAYSIYQMRSRYGQPDTPKENFLRAIEIVYEKHHINAAQNT